MHNVSGGLNITLPDGAEYAGQADRYAPMRMRDGQGAPTLTATVTTRDLLESWQPDRADGASRQHYIETGHYLPVSATREPPGPYVLDEGKAREWLTLAIANTEGREKPDVSDDRMHLAEVALDSNWTIEADEWDSSVWADLVSGAWFVGAITGPAELTLVVDCDANYQVSLIPPGRWYRVVSMWEKLRCLGDHEARGIDAAMSVLREVVADANRLASEAGIVSPDAARAAA